MAAREFASDEASSNKSFFSESQHDKVKPKQDSKLNLRPETLKTNKPLNYSLTKSQLRPNKTLTYSLAKL